jgi:hypothetical protein
MVESVKRLDYGRVRVSWVTSSAYTYGVEPLSTYRLGQRSGLLMLW